MLKLLIWSLLALFSLGLPHHKKHKKDKHHHDPSLNDSDPVNFGVDQEMVGPDSLSFLILGDWGLPENVAYERMNAQTMNTVANLTQSKFVLAIGDNFYAGGGTFDGVQSATDTKWQKMWSDVYTGIISSLPWYAILGNHDWLGNPKAQIEYTSMSKIWRMPDFFYTESFSFGNSNASFVFLDTDLIAYGAQSEEFSDKFAKQGWDSSTLEKQFAWIETQLKNFSSSDYLFVVGYRNTILLMSRSKKIVSHHDLGTCRHMVLGDMPRLEGLLEKYHASAYIFGHQHSLAYLKTDSLLYIQSGAGGRDGKICEHGDRYSGTWGQGNTFGFASAVLNESLAQFDFYDYTGKLLSSIVTTPRNQEEP